MNGIRNASVGAHGERIAERHLREQGMTVLDRNWRCHAGEIDLVLREGDVLVVCEVKTRRDLTRGHPVAAVDDAKARRLHLLALLWQESRGVRAERVRLDVVGVVLPPRGAAVVEHVRGIG
ncbi:YraN family protein [Marmoricola sp. RAF53]|uniref:YraN family protein n=1 Tax=Marmoricola sp. RAF53 TaxID=3233059 RepID=UPI003F9B8DDC